MTVGQRQEAVRDEIAQWCVCVKKGRGVNHDTEQHTSSGEGDRPRCHTKLSRQTRFEKAGEHTLVSIP